MKLIVYKEPSLAENDYVIWEGFTYISTLEGEKEMISEIKERCLAEDEDFEDYTRIEVIIGEDGYNSF